MLQVRGFTDTIQTDVLYRVDTTTPWYHWEKYGTRSHFVDLETAVEFTRRFISVIKLCEYVLVACTLVHIILMCIYYAYQENAIF